MKKMIAALSLCICAGIISGCGAKARTIECELSQKSTYYDIKSTYKIYATGDIVDKVETVETATSDDKDILDTLEDTLNDQYSTQKESYGGYDFNITNDGSKVESKVTIDYSKVDMDKLTSDNTALKSYVNKNNRLTVDGVISVYEAIGAVCKK